MRRRWVYYPFNQEGRWRAAGVAYQPLEWKALAADEAKELVARAGNVCDRDYLVACWANERAQRGDVVEVAIDEDGLWARAKRA